MNASLKHSIVIASLIAAVPAAGIASAHGDSSGEHRGDDGPKRPCVAQDRGRGYEAQGLLADGSSLTLVAGADTPQLRDDRYAGTLVVQVKQGDRRGRRDRGLTSYSLDGVPVKGAVAGAAGPLPAVGTRVQLEGRLPKVCPPAGTTPDSTTPVAVPQRRDEVIPVDSTPVSTTPVASPAKIKFVAFKVKGQRGGGEDHGDRPASTTPRGDDHGDDHGGDRPKPTTPSSGGDRPKPTTPSTDGPKPTTPRR